MVRGIRVVSSATCVTRNWLTRVSLKIKEDPSVTIAMPKLKLKGLGNSFARNASTLAILIHFLCTFFATRIAGDLPDFDGQFKIC